jgi:glutamate synthase domain-containing protein 2/nitrite reductase/ring-hydroxylating ferredoxin subunit
MAQLKKICRVSELEEGRGREVIVNGRPLALFLYEGKVYALDNRCPHREGQLSDGHVKKGEAICPLHGWNFDLKTGVSPYNINDAVATYPASVKEDTVYIDSSLVPPLPEAGFSGYQGRWKRWHQDGRGHHEVRDMAKGRKPPIEAMGSLEGDISSILGFDHFHMRAAQLERMPRLKDEAVSIKTVIGKGAGKPLELSLPAYISHMSFGALSREAKIALARGSRMAQTLTCSGEGGMHPEERKEAGLYILEMASGYFGFNEENISKADAVEIKMGQSAKPGLGGELPAAKVTVEIADVRGLKPGEPAVSPSRFRDIGSLEEMAQRISQLRKVRPQMPIGIKLAANNVRGDVAAALSLNPDFITIDGFGGGTGASPVHVRDHFGMPLVQALVTARSLIEEHNAKGSRPVSLIATGGVRLPSDVMKCIALGADACALATASLFALGCEYYRACESGNCPVGIATHKPHLRERLDIEKGAKRVANFYKGMGAMIEDYLRAMGHESIEEVSIQDLIPVSEEARNILVQLK